MADIIEDQDNIEQAKVGLETAADQSSKEVRATNVELFKKLRAQDPDMADEASKVVNNPLAAERAVEETNKKGEPSGNGAIIAMALASVVPSILGGLFEGTAGAVSAAEGSLKGASTGLDMAGKMQDMQIAASQEARAAQAAQEGKNPLANKVLIDSKSGRPVMQRKGGGFQFLDGSDASAADIITQEERSNANIVARQQPNLQLKQEALDYRKGQDIVKGGRADTRIAIAEATLSEKMSQNQENNMFREAGLDTSIKSKIANHPSVKSADKQLYQFRTIDSLLANAGKNPISANAIPTFLTRAAGEVGALTESDKMPFKGAMDWRSRAKQFVETSKTGTLTAENIAFLKDFSKKLQANVMETRNAELKKQIDLYKNNVVTSDKLGQSFGVLAPNASVSDKAARLAELKRKMGVK